MKKKYLKKSELTEMTNMGFRTMSDDFHIDEVNDALSQVEGLGFTLHIGSKKPRTIRGGGHTVLKIEDINESVAKITEGMDGFFIAEDSSNKKKSLTRKLLEEIVMEYLKLIG